MGPIVGDLIVVAGSIFIVIGGIGLIRFPDFFPRMHAGGVTDTFGAGLVLTGLAIQAGMSLITVKLLLLLLFLWLTSPTATHALANSALEAGLKPKLERQEEAPSS